MLEGIRSSVGSVFESGWTMGSDAISATIKKTQDVFGSIDFSWVQTQFGDLGSKLMTLLTQGYELAASFVSPVTDAIKNLFASRAPQS